MLYSSIVFLPLIGAILTGLFGKTIGARKSELITSILVAISALLSWYVLLNVGWVDGKNDQVIVILKWLSSGALDLSWSIRVDTLTAVMLVVVNTVSAIVHFYSIGYMQDDPSRQRFFSYLSLKPVSSCINLIFSSSVRFCTMSNMRCCFWQRPTVYSMTDFLCSGGTFFRNS